jgi:hypothetical protein
LSRIRLLAVVSVLVIGAVFGLAGNTVSAAPGLVTMTIDLVTCTVPGSASSIRIDSTFDDSKCDTAYASWDQPSHFLIDRQGPDGGDGVTSVVFSGLTAGESYNLTETSGNGEFSHGYTFTAPDSDFELYAVLAKFYTPDTNTGGQDEGSGSGDGAGTDDPVTELPETGVGIGSSTASGTAEILLILATLMAACGLATYPRRENLKR